MFLWSWELRYCWMSTIQRWKPIYHGPAASFMWEQGSSLARVLEFWSGCVVFQTVEAERDLSSSWAARLDFCLHSCCTRKEQSVIVARLHGEGKRVHHSHRRAGQSIRTSYEAHLSVANSFSARKSNESMLQGFLWWEESGDCLVLMKMAFTLWESERELISLLIHYGWECKHVPMP